MGKKKPQMIAFRRIPRFMCDETIRVVEEGSDNFMPKVSTEAGASRSQEESRPGTSKP